MKNNRLLIEVSAVLEKDPILQQRLQRSLDNIKLNLNPIGLKIDTTNLEAQIKEISSLLSKGMEIKPLDLTDTIGQIETLKKSIIEVNTLKEQTSKATLIKSGVEKPDISESVVKSESNVPKLTDDLGNLSKAKKEVTLASKLMDAALSTGLSMAIDLVIGGVMKLADKLITTKAELREFNEEATKVTKDNVKTVENVEGLVEKSKDLEFKINASTNVNEINKLKLELIEIQKELANALPEAISGFDSEGNAIAANNKMLEEALNLKHKKTIINAQNFMSENGGIENIKRQTSEYSKLREEVKQLESFKEQGKTSLQVGKVRTVTKDGEKSKIVKTVNIDKEIEEKTKKMQELMELTQQASIQAGILNKYDNQNIDTNKLLSNVLSDNTDERQENKLDILTIKTEEYKQTLLSLGYTAEEVENKMKDIGDTDISLGSKTMIRDATQAFGRATSEIDKIREISSQIKKEDKMTSSIMSSLASSFPDIGNNIFDVASAQDFLNGKIRDMGDIQNEAYQIMLGNDKNYYNELRSNGDGFQQAVDRWASIFTNVSSDAYKIDVGNYTTLNQAKAGITQLLAEPLGTWLTDLVGGSAEAYTKDLKNYTDLAKQKGYVLEKLNTEMKKLQNNYNNIVTELNENDDGDPTFMMNGVAAHAKKRVDELKGSIEDIDIEFEQFNKVFGGEIPNFSKYSDALNKGSKDSSKSSKEKTEAYKKEADALEKVNAELEKNKLLEEREEDSQKKIQWKQREIALLIQKSTILDQIHRKMDKANEKDLLDNRNQWEKLQNEVKKLNDEILNLRIEDISSRSSKEFNKLKEQLADLDLQEAKLDEKDLNGKLDIANKRADLVKKQIEEKLKQLDQLTKVPVTNETEKKKLDEEYAKEIDALRDLQIGYENLNKKVKDVNKEKLQMIEEVESQITEVIKNQVEQRKKSIEDEYNKRVETINKIKKLYNQENEEVDRNKELSDMQGDLDTIKREYEESLRDMSMAGKKRSDDLLKQIEEQELKITELIDRQERDRYNEFLDSQLEHLDEQKKDDLKEIEDRYTDEKIAEIVKGAMLEGFFTDIEGNIVSVKEAYIDYMDEFNNGTSLAGARIKSELLDSMNQVKDSVKEIASIWDFISVKDFSILSSSLQGITSIPQTMAYNIRNAYNQNTSVPINMPLNFNMGMADKDFIERVKRNSQIISQFIEDTIMRDSYIRK